MKIELEKELKAVGALVNKGRVLHYDKEFLKVLVSEIDCPMYTEHDTDSCVLLFSGPQVKRALDKWKSGEATLTSISREEQKSRLINCKKLDEFENVTWYDCQHQQRFTIEFMQYFVKELGNIQIPDMSDTHFNYLISCSTSLILEKAEKFSKICKEENKEFKKAMLDCSKVTVEEVVHKCCKEVAAEVKNIPFHSKEFQKYFNGKFDEEGSDEGGFCMPLLITDNRADQAVKLVKVLQELLEPSELLSRESLALFHSFASEELIKVINTYLRKDVDTIEMLKKYAAMGEANNLSLDLLNDARLVFDRFCGKEIECPKDYEIDGCTKCPLFTVTNLIKTRIKQLGGKVC